ncbi:Uncharacterised protein [uncultured archaeon]|nr:Uncharacterised protein [uncultured archaeon]
MGKYIAFEKGKRLEKTKTLGKAAGKILPLFAKDSVSDFTDEILREDEYLRNLVLQNPDYRGLLEQHVSDQFKKYKGVLTGAKLVDSWDRVTSAIGMAAEVFPGLGTLVDEGEELVELIPKGIYAVHYVHKTKDWKAPIYWTAAEAASFIPIVGDAIDMTNIYVNRARKVTKDAVKKEFRKTVTQPSRLERLAA